MVANDGWPSTIHGCKEDGKKRRLDEDKRWDSKEKRGSIAWYKEVQFLVVRMNL